MASPSRREKHTFTTQEVLSSCFPTTTVKRKNFLNLKKICQTLLITEFAFAYPGDS
jgi:hypothetical protein